MNDKHHSALIVGATGLVGSCLLQEILKSNYYAEIILVLRRRIEVHDKRVRQIVIDFNHLEDHAHLMVATHYFCLLGTTMKAAGSKTAFQEVDYVYPLQLGKIAKKNAAEKFLVVTALGANSESNIFYNRIKGNIEQALQKLHLNALYIFQPSLLGGNRKESRIGEKIGMLLLKNLDFVLVGSLKKYRITDAQDLAKALLVAAKTFSDKYAVISSLSIAKLSQSYTS